MLIHFDYLYAIFYLVLIVLSYFEWKTKEKKYAKIAILFTFVFIGFRAPVVGADTLDYVKYLTGETNYYNADSRELEILFVYYREVISSFISSRFTVMIINTVISMSPVFVMFYKYSFNTSLSLLLFFYLGCTSIYFVGLRQIIGFSFILWALLWTINNNRRNKKIHFIKNIFLKNSNYIFLIVAIFTGYLFHTANIVYGTIILLSLLLPKMAKMYYYLTIVLSALLGFVFKQFQVLDFFSFLYSLDVDAISRISVYLENTDLKKIDSVHLLFRMSILGMLSIYFMDESKINHLFSRLFVLGVAFYNLFYAVPMMHRFVPIFSMFGCVVYTWMFGKNYYYKKKTRAVVNAICLIVVLYFTRSKFIELDTWDPREEQRMHPYFFIFQNYENHPSI